jgi:hypothetical protein
VASAGIPRRSVRRLSTPFLVDESEQRISHRLGAAVVVQSVDDPIEILEKVIR